MSLSNEDLVEVTLLTFDQAVKDTSVDTSEWKNRLMARMVEEYRQLKTITKHDNADKNK